MKLRKDYSQAVALYESGASVYCVAALFNVTRSSMQGALGRRGVIFRKPPGEQFGCESHFFRHGTAVTKVQTSANNQVRKAVRDGTLIPKPCESCGVNGVYPNGRRKVQAHHDDYEKPLAVRWYCKSCHYKWHAEERAHHRG